MNMTNTCYLMSNNTCFNLARMENRTETLKDRILTRRLKLELSQQQLADKAGVSQVTIQHLESGRNRTSKKLVEIARALGVSAEWLMSGVSPSKAPGDRFESNVSLAPQPRRSFEYPEISWVQAGAAKESVQELNLADCERHASEAWAGDNGFWLRVVGPSMTPVFQEGMVILVAPDIEPENGQYVVARMIDTDEATFKQFIRDSGRYYLKPLNPSFPTTPMDDTWEVVGTVIDGKLAKSVFR